MFYLKIRVVPVMLLIFLTALCATLGRWQLDRMHAKQTITENIASRAALSEISLNEAGSGSQAVIWGDLRYRRLQVQGRPQASRQFLLDNQIRNGVAGYNILTPYLLDNGKTVIVDRGWIAGEGSRNSLPDIRINGGKEAQTITGSGYVPYPALMWEILDQFFNKPTYSSKFWPKIVLHIDTEDFSKALSAEVLPVIVRLDPDQPDGYLRIWPGLRQGSVDRHLGYAVQWFALSLLFFIILAAVTVKRRKKRHEP